MVRGRPPGAIPGGTTAVLGHVRITHVDEPACAIKNQIQHKFYIILHFVLPNPEIAYMCIDLHSHCLCTVTYKLGYERTRQTANNKQKLILSSEAQFYTRSGKRSLAHITKEIKRNHRFNGSRRSGADSAYLHHQPCGATPTVKLDKRVKQAGSGNSSAVSSIH